LARTVVPILQQHAEEVAFLWLLRESAVRAPHYTLRDLADLDDRIAGHLDGLRVAADRGLELCLAALRTGEPGEVFAAAVLALESSDGSVLERVLDVALVSEGGARAVVSAFGWISAEHATRWSTIMLRAGAAAYRAVGVGGLAVRREDPGEALVPMFADENRFTRARALRAVGELKRHDLRTSLNEHLASDASTPRFWATWSAVLLGDGGASRQLRDFVTADSAFADRAVRLAPRVMPLDESRAWLKGLASREATRRYALVGCGASGDPAYVPALISQMAVSQHARAAGEAFSMITGADLGYEDLEGEQPDGFEAVPNEDPADEHVETDPDEDLPWPEQALVQKWWEANAGAFRAGQRYLRGHPVTVENCRRVLREGFQRQRIAAAYEIALAVSNEPLFEWRAPGYRQQALLA
jgi:uncharacterized protein (TIGR02270 family)